MCELVVRGERAMVLMGGEHWSVNSFQFKPLFPLRSPSSQEEGDFNDSKNIGVADVEHM